MLFCRLGNYMHNHKRATIHAFNSELTILHLKSSNFKLPEKNEEQSGCIKKWQFEQKSDLSEKLVK